MAAGRVLAAIAIGGGVLAGTASAAAGANVLTNPGAEADVGAVLSGDSVVVPSGWTTTTVSAQQYNDTGYPTPAVSQSIGGGANLFTGGNSAVSTATQTIDVSASAAAIDAGGQGANLSAFLGGFRSQEDHARVTADFRDGAGRVLTTLSIGPVTAAERGNATTLLARSSAGSIPRGTRTVLVTLTATRTEGSDNDGYADNLSLDLSVPVSPGDERTGATRSIPVRCGGLAVTITGTDGRDVIRGTEGRDVIATGDGRDTVFGLGGDDVICAGTGNDVIRARSGNNRLYGDAGNDVINSGDGNDRIWGGFGNDRVVSDAGVSRNSDRRGGRDVIWGGPGNDNVSAGPGNDVVYGRAGNDRLRGGLGNDKVYGDVGDDWINGGRAGRRFFDGGDQLFGGDGDDRVLNGGNAIVFALLGRGDDVFVGGSRRDLVRGGSGNDTMLGRGGNDALLGGSGFDRAYGGPGFDRCIAERRFSC